MSSSSASSTSSANASSSSNGVRYIGQKESQIIDEQLMSSTYGFSSDQLMELAALSCAQAINDSYPASSHPSVLIICGPGNNGGDGLVCARHLVQFGYRVRVLYPKEAKAGSLYARLLTQCQMHEIPILSSLSSDSQLTEYDLIVDAIFGFSFDSSSPVRSPFASILSSLRSFSLSSRSHCKLISIDVPSGCDIEKGDIHSISVVPDMLISLTSPKLCARGFKGKHYLGGRFIPPAMAEKMELRLPKFEGGNQFVLLQENENSKEHAKL